jgi:hypothetical protein
VDVEQDSLVEVGEYTRDLGASLQRMFENALDWEHLPHLHSGSFASIALVSADDTGWRAEAAMAGSGVPLDLELRLDTAAGRWVTTTHAAGQIVSRITTDAVATGKHACRIRVRFEAGVPESQREAAGAYFSSLYAQLYDEDEAMMIARQAAIDAPDRRFRIVGERRIPAACPHLGLPLGDDIDDDGIITCPWHAYRFDTSTGKCVSGATCAWAI